MGSTTPFTANELRRLYPDPAVYLAKFNAATDALVTGRWISKEDAEAMKADAMNVAATLGATETE